MTDARVSTAEQDLDTQIAALKREGCTTIRSEKRSGAPLQGHSFAVVCSARRLKELGKLRAIVIPRFA
jgi:hypothetical protein